LGLVWRAYEAADRVVQEVGEAGVLVVRTLGEVVAVALETAGDAVTGMTWEFERFMHDCRGTFRRALLAAELFVLVYAIARLCLFGSAKRSLADSGRNPEANIDAAGYPVITGVREWAPYVYQVGPLWRHGLEGTPVGGMEIHPPGPGRLDQRAGTGFLRDLDMSIVQREAKPVGSYERGIQLFPTVMRGIGAAKCMRRLQDAFVPAWRCADGVRRPAWISICEIENERGHATYKVEMPLWPLALHESGQDAVLASTLRLLQNMRCSCNSFIHYGGICKHCVGVLGYHRGLGVAIIPEM
jgi:hypothetical protein